MASGPDLQSVSAGPVRLVRLSVTYEWLVRWSVTRIEAKPRPQHRSALFSKAQEEMDKDNELHDSQFGI